MDAERAGSAMDTCGNQNHLQNHSDLVIRQLELLLLQIGVSGVIFEAAIATLQAAVEDPP